MEQKIFYSHKPYSHNLPYRFFGTDLPLPLPRQTPSAKRSPSPWTNLSLSSPNTEFPITHTHTHTHTHSMPQISNEQTNFIEITVNLESLCQINFSHRSLKSSHRYKENSPHVPKISKKNVHLFHIEILHRILLQSLCHFTIISI